MLKEKLANVENAVLWHFKKSHCATKTQKKQTEMRYLNLDTANATIAQEWLAFRGGFGELYRQHFDHWSLSGCL